MLSFSFHSVVCSFFLPCLPSPFPLAPPLINVFLFYLFRSRYDRELGICAIILGGQLAAKLTFQVFLALPWVLRLVHLKIKV